MFTRQAPLLGESLFLSGMPPALASTVQNLLGQCRAPIVHRGPVTLDYTRPSMRLITPDTAKYNFPNLNLPKPQTFGAQEETPPEEEEEDDPPPEEPVTPFTPPEHIPGGGDVVTNNFFVAGGRYFGGNYISVDEPTRSIHANALDKKRHCVFPNNLNRRNHIHSVDYKGRSTHPQYIALDITDKKSVTEFFLQVKQLKQRTYVTDVEFAAANQQLYFNREKAWVFDPQPAGPNVLATRLVTVVTDVILGTSGLEIHKKQLHVLEEGAASMSVIPVQDCPPSTLGD
jgi:hypothetical protein